MGSEVVLIKPRDAAKRLAISERSLWEVTNRGGLPCVRIGRSVRYDPVDLANWVERQKALTSKDQNEDAPRD
jgi:excisionase family DNA binding protein